MRNFKVFANFIQLFMVVENVPGKIVLLVPGEIAEVEWNPSGGVE